MKHDSTISSVNSLNLTSIFSLVDYLADENILIDPARSTIGEFLRSGRVNSVYTLWRESGLASSDVADAIARHLGLPRITAAAVARGHAPDPLPAARYLKETACFPLLDEGGAISLAMADPGDLETKRAVELALGAPVRECVASFDEIAALHARCLGDVVQARASALSESDREETIENLRDLAAGAPVVRAVESMIERAIELRASDIHVEPTRGGLVVRMRVDGLLRSVAAPPDAPGPALISRIKILAGLNIAERRLPQDGAARVRSARGDIDLRVATMPTQHGEAAVIRILPWDRALLDVARLGLSPRDEVALRRVLDLPHGLAVVTGPTGSGKTTTLATLLSLLNTPARKILTIEDPVEYEVPGVNQTQVRPSIGLTFAAAMRAFVRQDPDVIMVGEIRDAETAGIAIHAALTGHLVLTTLHTETAAAAIPRLIDLGVEPFLLKSTLRFAMAQRLVRVLCPKCKARRVLASRDLAADPRYEACGFAAGDPVFEPKGCDHCAGAGYRGRVGVFEALEVSGSVRERVRAGVDAHELDRAAIEGGMTTLLDDAVAKCRAGLTSPAEALRVTTAR